MRITFYTIGVIRSAPEKETNSVSETTQTGNMRESEHVVLKSPSVSNCTERLVNYAFVHCL